MSTNTELLTAFFAQVQAWATVPVAYPGITFTPPATGQWLEIYHAPNDLDPDLAGGYVARRGLFTVSVVGRPNSGFAPLYALAESIVAKWHKLTPITGTVQVTRTPYIMGMIESDSRNTLPVTIEYHE